ncbi:MAG: ankyrin repeat domain-containing protein [Synergistaceae bacterium]|nr:ankyrin repeat domain-containing protein [Synergistaceae bacterium]
MQGSFMEEMEKLTKLRDSGELTEEEFVEEKKKLFQELPNFQALPNFFEQEPIKPDETFDAPEPEPEKDVLPPPVPEPEEDVLPPPVPEPEEDVLPPPVPEPVKPLAGPLLKLKEKLFTKSAQIGALLLKKERIPLVRSMIIKGLFVALALAVVIGLTAGSYFYFKARNAGRQSIDASFVPPLAELNENLLDAVKLNNLREAQKYIEAGANVNARNKNGFTALMTAAGLNPNPDIITALAMAGADVNAKDSSGRTALMLAALLNPSLEVTAALLKAGADVGAKEGNGLTALEIAKKENENPRVAEALQNALSR